jgi:hypothetical protein
MIIDEVTPIQYPPGYDTGPWGVCSVGMYWYVVDKDTFEAQQIGLIGRSGVLSQALEEAARRNAQIVSMVAMMHAPQPQKAADVKEAQVVSLNSPKG